MKKAILLISVLIISLISAFGQIDNNYKATLKKMLEVAGTEATFKMGINQMFDMYKKQMSGLPDSILSDFKKEFLKTSVDELVDMLAPVYQKYLTETDLKEIIGFYQTPAGKKFAEKNPLILQESMQVGQQWGMKIGQQFQEKLKQKGY